MSNDTVNYGHTNNIKNNFKDTIIYFNKFLINLISS